MNVSDYLSRIRFTQNVKPDQVTLRGLHRAHLLTVPFENLDILPLGRRIRLDEQSLWDKIVVHQRGGFCYELNGMFAWLLQQIGFEVTYLDAVTYYPETDRFGIDFDHLALMVGIPTQSARWLVDVGYGDNFTVPLDMDDPNEQAEGLRGYRLEPFRDGYQLWQRNFNGTRQSQYYFDLTAHNFPSEYEAACHYHQTSPDSIFTKRRMVSQATENGRITLEGGRTIRTKNGVKTETPFDESEFPNLLKKHFGIVL
jgi:N-hydroxyarylamine O-acetyltransferase